MSGISKTIERLKELSPRRSIHVEYIMPIITAYEQSQKELETAIALNGDITVDNDALKFQNNQLKTELSTANKRIAELGAR